MKFSTLASAIALSLGLAGQASAFNTISFDRNGTASGGGILVDSFDWLPGNALSIGALGQAGESSAPQTFTTVYQAKLNSFIRDVNGNQTSVSPLSGEFTIQVSILESQLGVGSGNANFTALGGTVAMFYDPSSDSNSITGAGYGNGMQILAGTIVNGTGTYSDATRTGNTPIIIDFGLGPVNLGSPCQIGANPLHPLFATNGQTEGCVPVLLDNSSNGDDQDGVLTHTGNGSSTVNVKVTSQDNNFFKSILTSMAIGLNDTTNLADPFVQTNPSDAVFGVTPSYSLVGGQRINGGDCLKGTDGKFVERCDFHFQSDGSTSFQSEVPEPATLALVGLGLFGIGMMRKRK